MVHWQTLLGDNILHVGYEALVANPAEQVSRITDYCNIAYDPACLTFYQRNRQVTTGSAVQVRHAVNTRSVGQWKRFSTQLEGVRNRFVEAGLFSDIA